MDREQAPNLIYDLRRAKNYIFSVHYCVSLCATLALSYPTIPVLYTNNKNNERQIRLIAPICSSNRSISSTTRKTDHTSESFHGRAELDSHADTTVTG